MKIFYPVCILLFGVFSAQKLKIIDSENGNPISNARIILSDEVLYSNDDGFVLLPEKSKDFEVSASGYQNEKLKSFNPVLKLKPQYKEIDEVNIKVADIDFQKLFKDVLKNYDERYYSKPSQYDIIYKQKDFDNDNLHFLLVADGKFWTSSNMYNAKLNFKRDYDAFFQIGFDQIKYFKTVNIPVSIPESEGSVLNKSNDFIGDLFFNYELNRLYSFSKSKESTIKGKLLYESDEEQIIFYSIKTTSGLKYTGKINYNKLDKVITHFELHYDQSGFAAYKRKTKTGEDYEYQLGNGGVIFDFYKKDGKYIPSRANAYGDGFTLTYKNEKHTKKFSREIIFQNFKDADSDGLVNKVDFNKKFWENIPVTEQTDSSILLSEEEQKFINEK